MKLLTLGTIYLNQRSDECSSVKRVAVVEVMSLERLRISQSLAG